ncbi:hypothetical protein COOONC_11859 [Cooperia oncophora]
MQDRSHTVYRLSCTPARISNKSGLLLISRSTLDVDGCRGGVEENKSRQSDIACEYSCSTLKRKRPPRRANSLAEPTSLSLMQRKLLGSWTMIGTSGRVCKEAAHYQSAATMRSFFACLMCFCEVLHAQDLWDEFADMIRDD